MKKLIVISILTLSHLLVQAQNFDLETIIDIKIDQLTLKEALVSISEKYDIKFSYSDSKLKTDRLVSAQYYQISLNKFLKDFFKQNNINYSIIDQQIVLFPFNSNQAIKIKGKVVNQLDGSPIPFANIALPESGKGSSSNEEGEFELSLIKLPSELLVSHLAHEKKLVYVYDDQEEVFIEMMPAQKELEEITIKSKGNKNAYYQLVRKALNKLKKSQLVDQYGKAFYRQKSSRDNQYTEIFEMFYDIRYSSLGIEDWAVQEGRYAFQQKEEFDIFLYNKNFTLLSRMFPLIQPATNSYVLPLNQDVKKYFELSLHDIIRYENRYIAIIDYKPNAASGTPAPTGQLYIDFEDYSVLKVKGKFTSTDLDIVGFSDKNSTWDNYQLKFELSFIDDQADKLYLDFIKIDHSFDYYFSNKFVGRINTNSFLTFYEQYTPAKNKKLGGPIDFKTSDVELIDQIGYNSTFWKEHPIVKRTPIEEKLINDFEQNEAFGAVFMNNDDEVVLLPDNKRSEEAEQLIARFEAQHKNKSGLEIYLSLDKTHYSTNSNIHFSGHIVDKWTFTPLVFGSVLTIELKDPDNKVVLTKDFDINNGTTYGEIEIKDITEPGNYILEAYTNVLPNTAFKTGITISPFPTSINHNKTAAITLTENVLAPEGGIILAGVPTKISYHIDPVKLISGKDNWKVIDKNKQLTHKIFPNNSGIGSFHINPIYGKTYTLVNEENNIAIPLQAVVSKGMSIHIDDDRSKSLKLHISSKPAIPQEIFVLTTYRGHVSSIFKTRLIGQKNTIDLPIQYLKNGVNDLVIIDIKGQILAQRKVFNSNNKINVEMVSARWKSRRSNRLELALKVSDENGKPIEANLNAIIAQERNFNLQHHDIRNKLYFGDAPWANMINFDLTGDSLYRAIDNLLILKSYKTNMDLQTTKLPQQGNIFKGEKGVQEIDEEIFAEVSVSGSLSSQTPQSNKFKRKKNRNQENETFWIPKLNIDSKGIAILEMKVPGKNRKLYINIQGISEDGLIGNKTLTIDPSSMKSDRNTVLQ